MCKGPFEKDTLHHSTKGLEWDLFPTQLNRTALGPTVESCKDCPISPTETYPLLPTGNRTGYKHICAQAFCHTEGFLMKRAKGLVLHQDAKRSPKHTKWGVFLGGGEEGATTILAVRKVDGRATVQGCRKPVCKFFLLCF